MKSTEAPGLLVELVAGFGRSVGSRTIAGAATEVVVDEAVALLHWRRAKILVVHG